jgi:hypothetical protein
MWFIDFLLWDGSSSLVVVFFVCGFGCFHFSPFFVLLCIFGVVLLVICVLLIHVLSGFFIVGLFSLLTCFYYSLDVFLYVMLRIFCIFVFFPWFVFFLVRESKLI